MINNILTQEQLKELLHYNPDTGHFTWRVRTTNSIHVGDVAGNTNHDGYIQIRIDGKGYPAHRLACLYMTGKWPVDQMDHIKHIRHDNRWNKLREATQQINGMNTSMHKNNTSGTCGVHWDKQRNKWHAQIRVEGKRIYLGRFIEKLDAICARKAADLKYGFHENHGLPLKDVFIPEKDKVEI